ncbi:uncharacterized protein LOC121876309 [Homarus americanus]|uniref:uncharacterized protein LOC121876309 n=1 Tax=Homarus americanus TaxID=6706 RepID=UPI001C46BC45|nr:uncharacterized protein LOC121876309 [Homarus americanus]
MGTYSRSLGVHLEDYNHLKYTISLTRVGQRVFSHVFSWGFIGGSGSIKEAIFSLPQYSQGKFRKDFNASQREKIIKGGPVSDFDITLIYKLLQLVCGLSSASDVVWITETSDSLEYYLYAIKIKRNEIAHENIKLSPTEMVEKLEALRVLFVKTIEKAEQKYAIDKYTVHSLLNTINQQLDAVRDSRVPLETEAEYKKELFASRRSHVIEEGSKESQQTFHGLCQVSVAPWLMAGQTVNVEKVFTQPRLKRDETQILQRQLSAEESYVAVCDVLQATECDGTQPQVTLLSALSGMGKSTLLKYIINRGVNDPIAIKNIDNIDMIIFLDCRNAAFSSLNAMTALLLPRTAAMLQQSEFKQVLLSLDLLLVLDDVDELDQKSFSILQEFLRVMSPRTRVLATVSREKTKFVRRTISALHKTVLQLEIEGIPDDQTLPFLQQTLCYVSPNVTSDQESESKLCRLISSKRPCLQEHLRSPEILSLLALSWAFAPDRLNTSTTVTEIFMLVEDLLIHKVLQSLPGASLSTISTQTAIRSNLKKYLILLSGVAAKCLRNGKFSIDSKDLLRLADDCKKLGLPEDYLISAFLNYTNDSSSNFSLRNCKVSFPRHSSLQYYAAWHITQNLRDAPPSATVRQILGLPLSGIGQVHESSFQSMMKYLVGMLSVFLPGQLKSRTMEIVDLLKDLGVKKASTWLQYIEEAKEEATLTGEILREMGDEWEVEDFAISSTLVNILKKTKLSKLVLTTVENPHKYPHLQEVLKLCAGYPKIRLSLHLYKHFWSDKTEVSDKFLNTVMNEVSPCMLEHFAGRLSYSAISRLPASLTKLALHITPNMLEALNGSLPSLKALQLLYLNLDACANTDPKTIPSLNIMERPVILSVDMWKITKATIEWSCDAAKAISKTYARLVLRGSDLDADGCSVWVDKLHQRGVTASWVVVGSTCDVSNDQLSCLQQSATKIGCGKFVWFKV